MKTKEIKAVQISSNDMKQLCGGGGFAVISSGRTLKNELSMRPDTINGNLVCGFNIGYCPKIVE